MSSPAQNTPSVMPQQNAKPTNRSLLEEIVEIKVGPSNTMFKIHKGLLCDRASYFRAVYQNPGDWKEKSEGLALTAVDPNTFQRFMLWLYFNNILDNFETVQSVPGLELINCYFFADERGIPAMQNHVIDAILERVRITKTIFVKHQRLIWDNTPDGSPLRRLLVDVLAMTTNNIPEMLQTDEKRESYTKSFIADVLVAKCRHPTIISGAEFLKRRCEYHIHDEADPRCP
ncbi:MAG: hypothetical protein LQ339_004024 [Xanthoria mediterranea]|nr:MAG: hypothetical protein LQ339_004024 [Xanthoria mediterranea]